MKSNVWMEGFYSKLDANNTYGIPGVSGPAGITQEWDEWREGHNAFWQPLILTIAKTLYENDRGMPSEEFALTTGQVRRKWEDLEQHEWDDFKGPARHVIQFLIDHRMLNTDEYREHILILLGLLRR